MDLLDVAELMSGEPFLYAFEECDLVIEKCMFIFHGLARKSDGFIIRDLRIILPVLVQTGDLAPVHLSLLIWLPVEHVRVDSADGKPLVIDPAPAVLEEPAGSLCIISHFQCVTGNIKRTVLIAELGVRRRFKRIWIDRTDTLHVAVKQEDMAIECPGTALCTGCAPESDLLDYARKTVDWILKEGIFFFGESGNAVRNGDERNGNHQELWRNWVAWDMVLVHVSGAAIYA
jgi:hypothetical protein